MWFHRKRRLIPYRAPGNQCTIVVAYVSHSVVASEEKADSISCTGKPVHDCTKRMSMLLLNNITLNVTVLLCCVALCLLPPSSLIPIFHPSPFTRSTTCSGAQSMSLSLLSITRLGLRCSGTQNTFLFDLICALTSHSHSCYCSYPELNTTLTHTISKPFLDSLVWLPRSRMLAIVLILLQFAFTFRT